MPRYKPEPKNNVLSVRVPDQTADAVDMACHKLALTRSQFLELAIREKLKEQSLCSE